jgi:predicted amidophosphoribosyltransferase
MSFYLPQIIRYSLQIAIGVYLVFGAPWLVNRFIPSNRPYCIECGYDLSKSNSANCPECGVPSGKHASTSPGTE